MFASSAIVGSVMSVMFFNSAHHDHEVWLEPETGLVQESVSGHGLVVKLVNLTSLSDGQRVQDIGRLEVQFFL